jgi:hypothetical protein
MSEFLANGKTGQVCSVAVRLFAKSALNLADYSSKQKIGQPGNSKYGYPTCQVSLKQLKIRISG